MHRSVRTAAHTITRAAFAIGVTAVVVWGLTRGGRRGTGGPSPEARDAQARAEHQEEQQRIRKINGLIQYSNSMMGVPSQGDAYGRYNRQGVFEADAQLSLREECECKDCAAVKYRSGSIGRDDSHLFIAGPTGIDGESSK